MTWSNKAIYDDHGTLIEILGVGNDITKLKETEENLKVTKDALERSNKDLEQFAYIASHDLREPLRAVSGFLELLLERYSDKLDSKGLEYIHLAVDGAKRLNDLLTGLLNYSKMSFSSKTLMPVSVESALRSAMSGLEKSIAENNAEIAYDSLPTVKIDSMQLMQVFLNLLNNAIKFRSEKPLKIHIGCQKQDNHWLFSVSDNGIGIYKENLEKIFMIFQRSHANKYPGQGIGLSICKKIIERNGGKIWVESELGQGSTFYFTLPVMD
jgi:light-regulated signal transduction histidine kinase (bacteriophytochrome)